MRKITLIGMMGSGKTTIGKILSEQTGISAIDLDNFIENKENKSISEIFKTKGEQYFRTVEANTIKEFTQSTSSQILSLGGGAFENEQTRELLIKNIFSSGITTGGVTAIVSNVLIRMKE